jgi:hypothetical protein
MFSSSSSLRDSVRWLASWCSSQRWLLLKLAVWLLLWRASAALQFGSVFVVLSCLALVFAHLSHDAADGGQQRLSAYSVFNRGGARMAGSLSMESWERQWAPLSSSSAANTATAVPGALQSAAPHPKRSSKAANQPCVCGSNKKYAVADTHCLPSASASPALSTLLTACFCPCLLSSGTRTAAVQTGRAAKTKDGEEKSLETESGREDDTTALSRIHMQTIMAASSPLCR